MQKGIGIAALVLAGIAVFIPLVGPWLTIPIAIAAVFAYGPGLGFGVAALAINLANIFFLSPSFWIVQTGMALAGAASKKAGIFGLSLFPMLVIVAQIAAAVGLYLLHRKHYGPAQPELAPDAYPTTSPLASNPPSVEKSAAIRPPIVVEPAMEPVSAQEVTPSSAARVEPPLMEVPAAAAGPSRGVQIAGMIGGALVLVGVAYWLGAAKKAPPQIDAPQAATVVPSPPPVAAPAKAPEPVAPAASVASVPVAEVPKEPPMPLAPAPKTTTAPQKPERPKAVQTSTAVPTAAVSGALGDGETCFNQKRYDCAVSSANAVLRMDAGNSRAVDLKRRAELEQKRALDSISIR